MLCFSTRRLLATLAVGATVTTAGSASADFTFTILHNNDGESALLPSGNEGGIARFVNLVQSEKATSTNPIMISSGDNFLAGTTWDAGLFNGVYYDAQALEKIGYDAVVIGNHDFDFGPGTLANFIEAANDNGVTTKFLSSNLDFTGEAALQNLFDAGKIARSTVVDRYAEKIGIVGATTPLLKQVSSPGSVNVQDVVTSVQAEIDSLTSQGVQNIIFVSHLQSVLEDLALIPQLKGVDIAIAGGGSELLANGASALLPSDSVGDIYGPYPIYTEDFTDLGNGSTLLKNADGQVVPVVTTEGNYGYLGKLVVNFSGGVVTNVDMLPTANDPIPVWSGTASPDADVVSEIEDPVAAYKANLNTTIIGTTAFELDAIKSHVRTQETNFGNLIADAMVWQASQLAGSFNLDLDDPVVGIQNGGGIRLEGTITPGTISLGDLFDTVPFANFVSVLEDLPVDRLLAALENAVSRVEFADGRFAQVSGLRFTYDPDAEAGSRIEDVYLDGDFLVQIIKDGEILQAFEDLKIDLVTIDFLLGDKDGYDWNGVAGIGAFTRLGVSYRDALTNYITDALQGRIDVPLLPYAEGGEGRIVAIPEPASIALLALGGLLTVSRRRSA